MTEPQTQNAMTRTSDPQKASIKTFVDGRMQTHRATLYQKQLVCKCNKYACTAVSHEYVFTV